MRGTELDQVALVEEGRVVGDARRLLHVVRDDHDRVAPLELLHELLDLGGGDRVDRRARLVHEDHLGLDGDRAGDAEPLLLAAGERQARLLELVLDLVPQGRLAQGVLDAVGELATC